MSATNGPGNNKAKSELPTELMEQIVSCENMTRASERVYQNQGSCGIDGMSVEEMKPYLNKHWSEIKEALLSDKYQPHQVKTVEIPKAGGGKRMLGITVKSSAI